MEKIPSTFLLSAILTAVPNIAGAADSTRHSVNEVLVEDSMTDALGSPLDSSEAFILGDTIHQIRPQFFALMPVPAISFYGHKDEQPNEEIEAKEGPTPLIKEVRIGMINTFNYPSSFQGEPDDKISIPTRWYATGAIDINTTNPKNSNQVGPIIGVIPTVNQVYAEVGKKPVEGKFSVFGALGLHAGEILKTQYPSLTEGSEAVQFADGVLRHLPQAYMGVSMPDGSEFKVGMQTFPLGLKDSSFLTWRSPLNTPALHGGIFPYFALGAKALIPLNQNHALELALMNGGENFDGKKDVPNMVAAYHFNNGNWELSAHGVFGSRQKNSYGVGELNLKYQNDFASLSGLVDIGFMEPLTNEKWRKWLMLSGQGSFKPLSNLPLNFALRGEVLFDKDGAITGNPNTIATQVGPALYYMVTPDWRINLEYVRKNGANNVASSPIFEQNDQINKGPINQAVFFSVMGYFDHPFSKSK